MSNPPKQKGTQGENEILELLTSHNIYSRRTESSRQSHDIWTECEVVVEVKFRKAWSMFKWIRAIRRVTDDNRWAIYSIHGDRRTIDGGQVGRVVTFDADFGTELLAVWHQHQVNG